MIKFVLIPSFSSTQKSKKMVTFYFILSLNYHLQKGSIAICIKYLSKLFVVKTYSCGAYNYLFTTKPL